MSHLVANKLKRIALKYIDSLSGRLFYDLNHTLNAMSLRPFELHLELTNICNANCVFCPYQFQEAAKAVMSNQIFHKAVSDFVAINGGSVSLTPRVGDPLVDPNFLERVRYLRSISSIDRIFLTTNGILLDKFGIQNILESGINTINISTAGFDKASYIRIYRTNQYERMRDNVTKLFQLNDEMGKPVNLSIGIRTDRKVSEIMKDSDFQPILKLNPQLDITVKFSSSGERIKSELLKNQMKLRGTQRKTETCANLYNGLTVFPNGQVGACACHVAVDSKDLIVGNILTASLGEIWVNEKVNQLRAQFYTKGLLNPTCSSCDVAQSLNLYRSKEGRIRAELNQLRNQGVVVTRSDKPKGIFAGG